MKPDALPSGMKTNMAYPKFIRFQSGSQWWVIEGPDCWVEYNQLGSRWQRWEIVAKAYPEKMRLADAIAEADAPNQHAEWSNAQDFADAMVGQDWVGDAMTPGQSLAPLQLPVCQRGMIRNTFGMHVQSEGEWKATSDAEVRGVLQAAQDEGVPLLPLGGGSNVLFTDDWAGWVLRLGISGFEVVADDGDAVDVVVGAGEVWHDFVMKTLDEGWGGVENLALIPGSVGASPMQNIGAYGVEVQDCFLWLDAISRLDGRLKRFDAEACQFGYRESIFKTTERDRWIIVRVAFRLRRTAPVSVQYGALKSTLQAQGHSAPFSRRQVAEAVIAVRQSKLPDPEVLGNAGSFFKNPVVSAADHARLKETWPDLAAYPLPNGDFKLAAGWLIDRAGWKGHDRGTHGVHDRQALVLVNRGGSAGSDILKLSEEIQEDIASRFGVKLEREVNAVPHASIGIRNSDRAGSEAPLDASDDPSSTDI